MILQWPGRLAAWPPRPGPAGDAAVRGVPRRGADAVARNATQHKQDVEDTADGMGIIRPWGFGQVQ